MGKDTLFTIDQVKDDNVVLKSDSLELSLPSSLMPQPMNIGEKLMMTLNTEDEYNKKKTKLARDVLQELIKEE